MIGDDEKYTVTVVSVPGDYIPTKPEVGDDREKDSSTVSASTIVGLRKDGDKDLSLDFGFVRPEVTVGDYVWFDVNKDGLQDATDRPIEGVELMITGPDGQPVKDVNGDPVAPVKTDASGKYLFEKLPVLDDNQSYTVTVVAPEGYIPTKPEVGDDRALDSSTNSAKTVLPLVADGAKDLSLDFGFVRPEVTV
ncbi:collagen-binding protein, partial [Tessaracoccus sp. OH4464_COT-324]